MADNFFKRLTVWQNWAHYLLLSGALWFINPIRYSEGVLFDLSLTNPVQSIMIFALVIAGADTLIHALFWFAPKPIRWRD